MSDFLAFCQAFFHWQKYHDGEAKTRTLQKHHMATPGDPLFVKNTILSKLEPKEIVS